MVMVIIILAILGGLTTGIILQPFRAFQDQARRAALVAEADLALTRMVRELRMALPNSVRVDASGRYLEFIPTTDGGRYRALPDQTTAPADGDILDFSTDDSRFDVLGELLTGSAAANDFVVVYNASAAAGTANAYLGDNRARLIGTGAQLEIEPTQFPFASLGTQRFDVVPASGPVSFYCAGDTLRRHTGYGFSAAQPTAFGAAGHLLASAVSLCAFDYQPGDHLRNGVVTLRLGLAAEGESIVLLYQAQVVNAP
jgi:MSHA biogenesis protein MshO